MTRPSLAGFASASRFALSVRSFQSRRTGSSGSRIGTTRDFFLALLRGKALHVLDAALDAGDVNAAKALFFKLASPADAPPQESQPEPEIWEDDAGREMALAFLAVADLARIGKLSPEVVEMLRSACRVFLADDLQPRPPIDVEAERVEVMTAPEPHQQPAAGVAVVIPICNSRDARQLLLRVAPVV